MPAAAQSPPGSRLKIASANAHGVVLELAVSDVQFDTVQRGGQPYRQITIPNTPQTRIPGAPQVPTRGTLLGIPAGAEVSVDILETETEHLSGYRLSPAPARQSTADTADRMSARDIKETFQPNPTLYTTNAFYPAQPVKIGNTGYLRDQAVAQVQFYPVQYNPVTGEVRLHRRILARVRWDAAVPPADSSAQASPFFETVLKAALPNYDNLERPPVRHPGPAGNNGSNIEATDHLPALKIGVVQNGLYRLTYNNLVGAGFEAGQIDPRTIKISNRGVEIPILVTGEADGTFDPPDTILFYGTAITTIYTTENIYWLSAGHSNGRRMAKHNGTPLGAAVPQHFPTTIRAEENTFYWQTIPNGAGEDHWFWGTKFGNAPLARSYALTLPHVSTAATTATVRARLKGRTSLNDAPDHHTRIHLNNTLIDDQQWDGKIIFDHAVEVPHALLMSGTNVITVEALDAVPAPDTPEQLYVNWFEVDYWRTYTAQNNQLLFGAPAAGTFQFEIGGFSSSQIDVFDITNPANVTLITGTTVLTTGSSYTLQFEDTAQFTTRYLALAPTQQKLPAHIEADQPTAWKSPDNGADYVIITHRDFYTTVQPLADHRSAGGLRVATVKVEDIYDEFNHGAFNPQAIRDFLEYAYHHWSPAPTYVLLVGDAYQDYLDNLNTGTLNYVPTQIVETDILGETPSDNWFVRVNGDDLLPDMFIGRLSAQTATQVEHIVNKIIQYEQNWPSFEWNKQALLVADDDIPTFETTSEQLGTLLPADHTISKIYTQDYPPGNPTTDITTAMNNGALLANYTGHGSVTAWGSWQNGPDSLDIFTQADIFALNNPHKLPVVTVANCLNGFFSGPQTQISVAEAFQRLENKGAVAVWAPTGLSYPSGHRALMHAFYTAIFQSGQLRLGPATTAAKISIAGQSSVWDELVETYVLFGDPAMRLAVTTSGSEGTHPVHLPVIINQN